MVTLEELVGRRLVFGLVGPDLTDTDVRLFRDTHAGGIMLYRRNFETPERFRALIDGLEEALGRRLLITTDQNLWIADGGTNRVLKYDLNGKYLYGWGGPGGQPGQMSGAHSLTVDQDGTLYLSEVFNGRVSKFRPKPGADPAKVVGQEHRYSATATN